MAEDFPRSESEYPEGSHPQHTDATPAPAAAGVSWLTLFLVVLAIAGALAYGFHEHRMASQLAAQNQEMRASLDATRSQIDAMAAKLNEVTAAPAEKPSAAPAATHRASAKRASARRRSADDPPWKQLQAQISEQGKQIDATRQDLSNTRTELTGSIARTHDELVLLEKKGERSYFEFDLDKSGQFQHQGPVGIRLKKANTKHEYADLELMVDDYKVSKKHVNIYEPVIFYVAENGRPVELVINSISRNHIHGYVSQPKYRASELEAMAGSATAGSTTSSEAPAPPQRRKLETPK